VRLSGRLRDTLAAGLESATTTADRAALGLAAIAEMAALVGDALRARAQAEIVRLGAVEAVGSPDPLARAERGGAERARDITAAVGALLADLAG